MVHIMLRCVYVCMCVDAVLSPPSLSVHVYCVQCIVSVFLSTSPIPFVAFLLFLSLLLLVRVCVYVRVCVRVGAAKGELDLVRWL